MEEMNQNLNKKKYLNFYFTIIDFFYFYSHFKKLTHT